MAPARRGAPQGSRACAPGCARGGGEGATIRQPATANGATPLRPRSPGDLPGSGGKAAARAAAGSFADKGPGRCHTRIDAQGVLTLGPVIGPSLLPVAAPAPDGATLAVDGEGFVSDGGSFRGFLTPDKNAVIAVHLDSSSPSATHQLTILQLTGRTFAQADLAGTWAFESLAGNVSPIWYHGAVEIGATGVARYLPPFRDSNGSTALPPDMALTLAPDGTMTQPVTNPSYRATLSMDGEMYVRTQTHNPPGRYGLGVALRR